MSIDRINEIDESHMYEVYEKWPTIARESWNENIDEIDIKNIDHVIFAGMGGSGTISDVMKAIFSKENIHINITKGYVLPKTVDSDTLIVVTSVSGNTDEALSILEQAHNSDAKIIAFSAGGKIEEFCIKNKIFYRKISVEHSPRSSFTKFLFIILNVLKSITPITNEDIFEAIKTLENTGKKIKISNINSDNTSLEIAKWIKHTPVIYYPNGLNAVATRFKNSLQENAKTHATVENIIESGHNGIVSWERDSTMTPILLTGTDDHKKTKDRWNIIREYFEMKNIQYKEISTIDGGILSKIMSMIYVLDYCSIYYAIKLGINPSPIESIDFIKERL